MDKVIFYAKNISELLTILKNNPGTKIVGGCTKIEEFPDKAISTLNIKDLNQIIRHERYLDVGPGVTLSRILEVGQNHLPQVLYDALKTIANPLIRNIATIGGNILSPDQQLTLYAPLLALDARLEFKNGNDTKNIMIRNFDEIPEGYVLSNIKIPLLDSDVSLFRRIGPENSITPYSAAFAFTASIEKNSLLNAKLTFAGPFTFQSNELENSLMGRRIPLNLRDIVEITELVEKEFDKAATDQMIAEEVRQQFLNLARYSFEQLT